MRVGLLLMMVCFGGMICCVNSEDDSCVQPDIPPVNQIEIGHVRYVPLSVSIYTLLYSETTHGNLYAAYISMLTIDKHSGVEQILNPNVQVDLYDLYYIANDATHVAAGNYTYSATPQNLVHNGDSEYSLSETSGEWVKLDKNMIIMVRDFGDSVYSISWNTKDVHGTPISGYYMGKVQF